MITGLIIALSLSVLFNLLTYAFIVAVRRELRRTGPAALSVLVKNLMQGVAWSEPSVRCIWVYVDRAGAVRSYLPSQLKFALSREETADLVPLDGMPEEDRRHRIAAEISNRLADLRRGVMRDIPYSQELMQIWTRMSAIDMCGLAAHVDDSDLESVQELVSQSWAVAQEAVRTGEQDARRGQEQEG